MSLTDPPQLNMRDLASQGRFFQWMADGLITLDRRADHLDSCFDEAKREAKSAALVVAMTAKSLDEKLDKHLESHTLKVLREHTIIWVLSTQWKLIGFCIGAGAVLGKFGHAWHLW